MTLGDACLLPVGLVVSPASTPPNSPCPLLSLVQSRRGRRYSGSSLLSRSLSLAPHPFARHVAESDNNNKINFQQFQLKEKRVQCFLSQKHRELKCQLAISDTWKTLCSVPAKLMRVFYFNGCALKELVVRYIVHHGNEVWGIFGPGILYFFFSHIPAISKGETRQ